MDKAHVDPADIRAEMLRFRAGFDSLNLATVSDAGVPEASAAPMVLGEDDAFYIFVSALAAHTANLQANARAGVLFIQPVEAARNAFARQRLSYQCRAETVTRDAKIFADVLQRFREQFGEIMEVLESLPDFGLFRLAPIGGTYIRGFGQAWRLSGPGLRELEPARPPADPGRNVSGPESGVRE